MRTVLAWLDEVHWRLTCFSWDAEIAWRRGWHRVRPEPPPPPGYRRIARVIPSTKPALDDVSVLEAELGRMQHFIPPTRDALDGVPRIQHAAGVYVVPSPDGGWRVVGTASEEFRPSPP